MNSSHNDWAAATITSFEARKLSVSNSWEPLIIITEFIPTKKLRFFLLLITTPKLVGSEQDQSYVPLHGYVVIRPEVISINLDYSRPWALESVMSIRLNYI